MKFIEITKAGNMSPTASRNTFLIYGLMLFLINGKSRLLFQALLNVWTELVWNEGDDSTLKKKSKKLKVFLGSKRKNSEIIFCLFGAIFSETRRNSFQFFEMLMCSNFSFQNDNVHRLWACLRLIWSQMTPGLKAEGKIEAQIFFTYSWLALSHNN